MAPTLYDKKPQPGDLIEISRGPYKHWGIYAGDDDIIHFAPPSEAACGSAHSMMSVLYDKAIVKKEKLWDVVGTCKYTINNLLDEECQPRSVSAILRDAKDLVGQELSFSVFQNNCEHFVTELRYGKPESRQVRDAVHAAVGVGVAAVGVGLLTAAALAIFGSGGRERRNSQGEDN